MNDNLWARDGQERHRDLYDAEYAKQLERIARIRSEVSATVPNARPALPPPAPRPATPRWDAAPMNLAPATPGRESTPRHRSDTPEMVSEPPAEAARSEAPVVASAPPAEVPAPRRRVWLEPDASAGDPHADAARAAAAQPDSADLEATVVQAPPPRKRRARSTLHGAPATGVAGRRNARRALAGRPDAGAPERQRGRPAPRVRLPGRRARWAAAVALAVAAGSGAAVLAARTPEAPAATVFRVPGQPTGLVAHGGRVWVAGPLAGEVWVLDGASGRPAAPPLRIGGTPARLALDGRFAWIADTERGGVVGAPMRGDGALRPLRTGPDVADVAVAAGAVWTASSADGTIRVIDADGRRQVLHVGVRPIALAADERRVVAADAAGAIIRLSARSRRPEGPAVPVGGAPSDIALSGERAWIADAGAGTVQAVVLSTGSTGPAIPVGRSPVAIAADARGVYVLCRGDRSLVELDAGTGAVRSRTPLSHPPTALALDPRHVWIAAGDHEVIRVDR